MYPENIPAGSTAFDLSATVPIHPTAGGLDLCPSCGSRAISQAYGGGDLQCTNPECDNLFTPERLVDPEPLIDPDCKAGKHSSCFGPPCECPHHAVEVALKRFGDLKAEHGEDYAAVMLLTGLSKDEIDALGGVGR